MKALIGLILGGGAGSRLHPLTLFRSKPAVPLAGKYRLIDVPVSNCINSGINRIFVLTQYNSASLNRHVAWTYQFDRFRQGFVSILAAEQTAHSDSWFQGTADAVRRSLPHLKGLRHSQVLILAGDQLYTLDYREMLEHHRRHKADITVGAVPVRAEEAPGFGILKTDGDHRITEFYEKPAPHELWGKESPVPEAMAARGRIFLASMGIYIFEKRALWEMLQQNPDMNDFGRHILPAAIRERRVVSYPFEGYWSDIGTIRSFWEAHLCLARKGPDFDMYNPNMPIFTNARMLPPAKVESAYVEDSLLGDGSMILNAHISNSVIGVRSFVGSNTTIKNSIVMGSGYYPWHDAGQRARVDGPATPGIHEECYIENAIIDHNVHIGRRCVINNREGVHEGEGPGFFIRDGIVVIPKNAVIEDDRVI